MLLKNMVAVITGGAKGIGYATALLFATEGATVVVADRVFSNRECFIKRDFSGTGHIYEIKLDVTDEEEVKRIMRMVSSEFGRVDILFNNAGIVKSATPFEDVPRESWSSIFEINMYGVVNCCKAVIPIMKRQKTGKIINITSLAGEVGGIRTETSYAASKAAVICITMSLAKYLGPDQIQVNAVSPGVIDTDMTTVLEEADLNGIPLRRIGKPEDVANAVLFLSSHMSDYITGVVLDINGGMHMR